MIKIPIKKCLVCGKKFAKKVNESLKDWNNRHKFCSRKCSAKYHYKEKLEKHQFTKERHYIPPTVIKKGQRLSPKTEFKKGHKTWNKGRHWTKKERQKISDSLPKRFEQDAPMWKGENAGYHAKHIYIVKKYGHSKKCEYCGIEGKYIFSKNGRKRWSIDWANKTGRYSRNIEDYIGLCRTHHNRFDKGKIVL